MVEIKEIEPAEPPPNNGLEQSDINLPKLIESKDVSEENKGDSSNGAPHEPEGDSINKTEDSLQDTEEMNNDTDSSAKYSSFENAENGTHENSANGTHDSQSEETAETLDEGATDSEVSRENITDKSEDTTTELSEEAKPLLDSFETRTILDHISKAEVVVNVERIEVKQSDSVPEAESQDSSQQSDTENDISNNESENENVQANTSHVRMRVDSPRKREAFDSLKKHYLSSSYNSIRPRKSIRDVSDYKFEYQPGFGYKRKRRESQSPENVKKSKLSSHRGLFSYLSSPLDLVKRNDRNTAFEESDLPNLNLFKSSYKEANLSDVTHQSEKKWCSIM